MSRLEAASAVFTQKPCVQLYLEGKKAKGRFFIEMMCRIPN